MKNERLYRIICEEMDVDYPYAMKNTKSRRKDVKDSRFVYFYIKRITTDETLTRISKFFDKDHTTAVNGIRKVKDWIEFDLIFKQVVQNCVDRYFQSKLGSHEREETLSVRMTKKVYDAIPKLLRVHFKDVKQLKDKENRFLV